MNRYSIDETHEVIEFRELKSQLPEILQCAGEVTKLSESGGMVVIHLYLNEPVTFVRSSTGSQTTVYNSGGSLHFLHRISNTFLGSVYGGTREVVFSLNLQLVAPNTEDTSIDDMRHELEDFGQMLARRPWVFR